MFYVLFGLRSKDEFHLLTPSDEVIDRATTKLDWGLGLKQLNIKIKNYNKNRSSVAEVFKYRISSDLAAHMTVFKRVTELMFIKNQKIVFYLNQIFLRIYQNN